MIKQKAPKDMTAVEFVAMIEESGKSPLVSENDKFYTLRWIKNKLNEPAPNPFTPDQLAWLRIEQLDGFAYAAMDFDREVRLFGAKPENDGTHWNGQREYSEKSIGIYSWIGVFMTPNDPEPLCFADYAPLDSPCEGGEKE